MAQWNGVSCGLKNCFYPSTQFADVRIHKSVALLHSGLIYRSCRYEDSSGGIPGEF